MSTPTIIPLTQTIQHPGLRVARLPAALAGKVDGVFAVVQGGEFGGRRYERGDLLVCQGAANDCDTVIIAPRGRGSFRLGTVQGSFVLGESKTPFSASRWSVAGRVIAVVTLHTELMAQSATVRIPTNVRASVAVQSPAPRAWRAIAKRHADKAPAAVERRQLSLFAVAA